LLGIVFQLKLKIKKQIEGSIEENWATPPKLFKFRRISKIKR